MTAGDRPDRASVPDAETRALLALLVMGERDIAAGRTMSIEAAMVDLAAFDHWPD